MVGRIPEGWIWPLRCRNCGRAYPEHGWHHCCPVCGDLFDLATPIPFKTPERQDAPESLGIGLYRHSFPLPAGADFITLGEGNTPLLQVDPEPPAVYVKCEHRNPTGSFKDRGTAVLVSALAAAGVQQAVEDSSGNAGASFAAYAARAGIQVRVFVPAYAAGPKRAQIASYGAEIVEVPGPRSAASEAVLREVERGVAYASHAHLPHGLAGMATVAFEMVDQLSGAPGAVITPVGQGTLLLGLVRGFQALLEAGQIDAMPRLFGVQARACAPLWAVQEGGAAGLEWVREGDTVAEGIRILRPLRGDEVLAAVEGSGGRILAVEEQDIVAGRDALARRGLYVEPTSAVVWPALLALRQSLPGPVILVLTGSGLKALQA